MKTHLSSPDVVPVQDHLTGHTGCLSRLLLVAWELKNLPRRSPSFFQREIGIAYGLFKIAMEKLENKPQIVADDNS